MLRSRWLWPFCLLQMFLYGVLIWYGCLYRQTWTGWFARPSDEPEEQTSGMGRISLEYIDAADVPILEQIAQGLNAPAAVAGGLLALPVDHYSMKQLTGAEQELATHAFTAVIVPIMWYLVIRATKSRNETRSRRSRFVKAVVASSIGFLAIVAMVIAVTFFLPDGQPVLVTRSLTILWITWGMYMLLPRLRSKAPGIS